MATHADKRDSQVLPTLERLAARGYEPMLEHYKKVAPHLNEPLYTRPVPPKAEV